MSSSELALSARQLSKEYVLSLRARSTTLAEELTARIRRFGRATRHEKLLALDSLSFDVTRGEIVGVIGRNGAGKSTLLKILSRVTEPSSGEAQIYGRVGSLLEVGTGFHPDLTGRENIFLNGAILGLSRREVIRRFDEIVAFAGTERFLDTPTKHYSSGMQVRLAFAVAAHLDPEILMIDEVLAVGDAQFQRKCLGKMKDVVSDEGRTILFVSHNLNAVEALCSRVICLESGRIAFDTTDVRSGLRDYLRLGSGESQPTWMSSGTSLDLRHFSPISFGVFDDNGAPATLPLRNDISAWIQIEVEITEPHPLLTIGFAVFDADSRLLFWSYQTDSPACVDACSSPGRRILRTRFPKRLLNEGAYRLEIIGGIHAQYWVLTPGASPVAITVGIQGGLSESPYWMAARPGILAPNLEWEVL